MMCPLLWFIPGVMTSSPGKLRECDFLLFLLFLSGLQAWKEHFQTLGGIEYVWELQKQESAGTRRAHTWLVCVPTPMGAITSQTSKRAMSTDCISWLSWSGAELQYLYNATEPDRRVNFTDGVLGLLLLFFCIFCGWLNFLPSCWKNIQSSSPAGVGYQYKITLYIIWKKIWLKNLALVSHHDDIGVWPFTRLTDARCHGDWRRRVRCSKSHLTVTNAPWQQRDRIEF